MRIQYRHPKLYDFLLRFLYPRQLTERFSREVGQNKSIFDVAAGYGRMSHFLDPSNTYYGIDLNSLFVEYGKKQGIQLERKDVLDPHAYTPCDVFLAVDIIHHLPLNRLPGLFDLIFSHAREKVIIIDPAFTSVAAKYGVFGKLLGAIFRMVDDEGINSKVNKWLTEKEWKQLLEERFSSAHGKSFVATYEKVGGHHFATLIRTPTGTQ